MIRQPLLTCALLCFVSPALAFDVTDMIAQCDAPLASAIKVAGESDAQSSEWNNLNIAIKLHRTACATPMALTCHLSDAAVDCFAQTVAALDAKSEEQRIKILSYAEEGGVMFGTMPDDAARTAEVRAGERDSYCAQNSSDAGSYIGVLGGDGKAACHLSIATAQWAGMSFTGSAPQAFSLLPPQ